MIAFFCCDTLEKGVRNLVNNEYFGLPFYFSLHLKNAQEGCREIFDKKFSTGGETSVWAFLFAD